MEPISEPSQPVTADSPHKTPLQPRWIMLAIVLAVAVVVTDQLTKVWAIENLTHGKPVLVLGETLQWLFATNSGAAFSFLSNATWVFTTLSSVVVLIIMFNLVKVKSVIWGIIGGLVLGGAFGNLCDRLFREPGFGVGHVIDFIYTPWMMPAIYNVADVAVVTGMGLFILCMLLGISLDGTRAPKSVNKPADTPEISDE